MKLIATEVGKVISQFPLEEIRPLGGIHIPEVIQSIKDRYSFSYAPDLSLPWEKVNQQGLQFRLGKLETDSGQIYIQELNALPDGIVATAQRTDEAEVFIDDLMAWMKNSLGMRDLSSPPTLWFHSQVVVEFDGEINHLLKTFDKISSSLGKFLSKEYKIKEPVQLSKLTLGCDRLTLPTSAPVAEFALERRINRPYDEQRFISGAPLRTSDHLRALEILEQAAATN